jgi:hypothetical protein
MSCVPMSGAIGSHQMIATVQEFIPEVTAGLRPGSKSGNTSLSELFGSGSFLSQQLCSPFARSALAGAAGSGEDSPPSLSQSALSTQDLCGAIAGVATPQARETNRLIQTLRRVGYVLGGWPGSSLLEQM